MKLSGTSFAEHAITALDPLGALVGLTGVVLLAYVIAEELRTQAANS